MERLMMKSSVLFECAPLPLYIHLMYTWHRHIIHVVNVPRPSQLFATLSIPCIMMNTNWTTKQGRPGNEASSKPLWTNVKIFWESSDKWIMVPYSGLWCHIVDYGDKTFHSTIPKKWVNVKLICITVIQHEIISSFCSLIGSQVNSMKCGTSYLLVTYFSVSKLWFTLRPSASAAAPEPPIPLLSRLWKSV